METIFNSSPLYDDSMAPTVRTNVGPAS